MITTEDHKTAHELLDQLLDQIEKGDEVNTIFWERAWVDNFDIHRTRYRISIDIEQVE